MRYHHVLKDMTLEIIIRYKGKGKHNNKKRGYIIKPTLDLFQFLIFLDKMSSKSNKLI